MKKSLIILTIFSLFFSACNLEDRDVAKIDSGKKARVIDSEVEGLEFQCAGIFKYTDKNGTLHCNHMPIAFMVGQIKLGLIYKIPNDSLIFPQDIADVPRENGDDENLIKILTILQSLDEDQNPENGIKITKELRDKLTTFIDIRKMQLEEIEELIQEQLGKDIEFKEPHKVLKHLDNSMKRFNLTQLKSKILEEFNDTIQQ